MARIPAIIIATAFVATPDLVVAQSKPSESPVSASRFGISIDGVQKPKAKGLKSSSSKKKGSAKSHRLENAWPKK